MNAKVIYRIVLSFLFIIILPRLIWDFGFSGIKYFIMLIAIIHFVYTIFYKNRSEDEETDSEKPVHYKSKRKGRSVQAKEKYKERPNIKTSCNSYGFSEKIEDVINEAFSYENFGKFFDANNNYTDIKANQRPFETPHKTYHKKEPEIQSLILDGSNICCWRNSNENKAQLPIIFSLSSEILKLKIPFHIFFDVNILHVLYSATESDKTLSYAFKAFLSLLPNNITIVPAGIRADEFILQKADKDNSHIISNDRYIQYTERYHWIANRDRLLKGTVIANRIAVPELSIDQLIHDYVFEGIEMIKSSLSHSKYYKANMEQSQQSASI